MSMQINGNYGYPQTNHNGLGVKQCTANTDRADREIENLKRKQQQLEQQIRAASDDERKELEKKLEQVEGELRQKDNDAYRRQNASVFK